MELPLLKEVVIILGLSVLIILIFQRLKIPSIIGFLATGVIAGPYGLSWVKATHEVELLSEIGVIFLLFVIGIEFSLKGLASIKRTVIGGGLLQVGLTIAVTAGATWLLGLPINQAVFVGFLFSLSSTAIVLKVLQGKGEIKAPHGRVAIAILIFQDIIVVPMMLITPIIAGEAENLSRTLLLLLVKVVVIVSIIIVLARYVVPVILNLVVKTKSRELFILTIVGLCFATAWLTSSAGLSLALGAFFAGLVISESDYSHQATANILPFREIFISFFFVSIGMLLDLRFFIDHAVIILPATLAVMLVKLLIVAFSVAMLRYPARTVFIAAFSLLQVGEFAFLLSAVGMKYRLLDEVIYQYFLSISIISMGVTPFIMHYASSVSGFLVKAPLPRPVRSRLSAYVRTEPEVANAEDDFHDHVVIIGYGINGENVAKATRSAKIPYVVIELEPSAYQKARKNNEPVIFGDASDEVILQHVKIQEARVVVIAIADPEATKKIITEIRQYTRTAYIIVRTRYIREIEQTLRLGADQVIPEEFETSIEIFTRVLKKYLITSDEIEKFVNHIRSYNYEMLRDIKGFRLSENQNPVLHIPDMEIATLPVQQGHNKVVGKKVGEAGLRTHFGVTILAIKRGDEYLTEVTPDIRIEPEDTLYVFGHPENISALNKHLKVG